MSKKSNAYTVFILPDPTSKPYSFSIGKKTVRYLLGVLLVGMVALSGFFAQSLSILSDISELRVLRNENKEQRVQIQSAINSVNDLKKQMVRLVELDEKLRVMTDLSPKKGTMRTLAQGGSEQPVDSLNIESIDFSTVGQPTANKASTQKVVGALQDDLKLLESQILEEEESFRELIKAISGIQLRWASTPSIWPVKGWVTSSFGPRTSPFTGRLAIHNGLDIAAHRGTPVVAPAVGVVIHAGYDNELGRRVFINHGFGKKTIFGHLNKQVVQSGQDVQRGDVIGYVGSTGKATGPHLHYEVRINNVPVDPMRYILN
jgi:murein DD-endopeptidase MepM/ murein hydrolase activator NlpD